MRQNKHLRKTTATWKKQQEQPQTSCKYSTHWQIRMILAFVLWGNLHIAVLNPSSVLHFSFTRLASFQDLSWISIEPHKSMTFSNYFLYVQFLFTFEQSTWPPFCLCWRKWWCAGSHHRRHHWKTPSNLQPFLLCSWRALPCRHERHGHECTSKRKPL